MALLEGKNPAEKKKIIAAAVLGVVSLVALYMAFGRSFFGGSSTTATTKASPSPSPKTPANAANNNQFRLPTQTENDLNMIVPVVYSPGSAGAPDAGRNIFAFYEPGDPPPYVPPPASPPPPLPTPTPPPPPPFVISGVTPNSRFAGTKGEFKLEVYGGPFTPAVKIYFNQAEMPTQFVNEQSLVAIIPDTLVVQEGQRSIVVRTPDGMLSSPPSSMVVIPPPKPSTLSYIGMIARARGNNDTAYFLETGKQVPFGARLNDVIASRFRVVSISALEVVVEDTSLGFRHRMAMSTTPTGPGGTAPGGGFVPYTPGGVQPRPGMIPQPQPPRPGERRPPSSKDDVDDNDNP